MAWLAILDVRHCTVGPVAVNPKPCTLKKFLITTVLCTVKSSGFNTRPCASQLAVLVKVFGLIGIIAACLGFLAPGQLLNSSKPCTFGFADSSIQNGTDQCQSASARLHSFRPVLSTQIIYTSWNCAPCPRSCTCRGSLAFEKCNPAWCSFVCFGLCAHWFAVRTQEPYSHWGVAVHVRLFASWHAFIFEITCLLRFSDDRIWASMMQIQPVCIGFCAVGVTFVASKLSPTWLCAFHVGLCSCRAVITTEVLGSPKSCFAHARLRLCRSISILAEPHMFEASIDCIGSCTCEHDSIAKESYAVGCCSFSIGFCARWYFNAITIFSLFGCLYVGAQSSSLEHIIVTAVLHSCQIFFLCFQYCLIKAFISNA